jgi:hypothetical protein
MMMIILAPEIGVTMAMVQYLQARVPQREQCSQRAGQTTNQSSDALTQRRKITRTHAFFANMGGYQVRYSFKLPPQKGEHPQSQL